MSEDTILTAISRLGDGLASLAGTIQGELGALRQDVTTLRQDVTTLRQDVTTLREGLTTLRQEVTTLRVDVLDRFDRVEVRFNEVRDDMTVTMGRADRAHQAADSTREELRLLAEEVAVLTRKQRRLDARLDDLSQRH